MVLEHNLDASSDPGELEPWLVEYVFMLHSEWQATDVLHTRRIIQRAVISSYRVVKLA